MSNTNQVVLDQATIEAMQAEIAKLRAENAALRTVSEKPLGIKISDKGAVSVYGIGRFPVTLYREQWVRLMAKADDLKAFFEANKQRLDEVAAQHAEAKTKAA